MWRACLVLLGLVAGSLQLSITEFIVPTTVEAEENASLQCRYNLTQDESEKALFVKWWWTPVNGSSDQRVQLYQRIAGHAAEAIPDNIDVDDNDGIILLNATSTDSGTYECEVSNIDEVRQHQELIVFTKGSGPQVNVTTAADGPDDDDEDDVLITCSAVDVAPYPDLQIFVGGEIVSTSEYIIGPSDGLYSIFQNATISKNQASGGEIRCDLYFENANITHEPYTATEWFTDPTGGCKKYDASWVLLATLLYFVLNLM